MHSRRSGWCRGDLEPFHGAAFGVQHNKVQPTQGMALAPFGYVPHFMGDEAADGVEGFVGIAALHGHTKGLGHTLDGGVAAQASRGSRRQ